MFRHTRMLTIIAAASLAATGAQAGTIVGTVSVENASTNKNAVVYIDAIPGKTFKPPTAHATMDQKNIKYIPHVLPVLVGTTVDFHNNDTVVHNVFSPTKGDKFNLGTFTNGQFRSHTFDKVGPEVILCHVHEGMEAWIVVCPTPYYALTGSDGSYEIDNVPPGKYKITVWDEHANKESSRRIVVTGSKPTIANIYMIGG